MGLELGDNYRVLKLGGALITDKRVPYSFREEVVRYIAKEIKGFKVILVHGGGSFGHYEASINDPFRTTRTALAMQDLNLRITRVLLSEGVKAFPLPGRCFSLDRVHEILGNGLVPVTYGDILPNGEIISGDDLTLTLAKHFKVTALFAVNIDGVIVGGKVKDRVNSLEGIVDLETGRYDVTGGIVGKIRKILQYKVNSLIFNGKDPANVYKALRGERVGTLVEAEG
ncbi:MAG: isopentenyl phosphate kinase [Candidatus Aramenus sp.]|jgi:isopentenyl phosphate kinase|nr:isopentenyl phosphate kinase [Candidatus Aramenus sp.]